MPTLYLTSILGSQTKPDSIKMEEMDDAALVQIAATGHYGAQQILYRRYIQRIYGFFVAQLRDHHVAEDLTQETFIRAFQGLTNFRGEASFKNWLYRIAKNQIADFYRDKHSRLVELDESLPPRQLQKTILDADQTQKEQKVIQKRLASVFFHLPKRYKEVLVLRFLKGFSLKETAAAMSLTLSNIKVLQHRAMKLARQKSPSLYQ